MKKKLLLILVLVLTFIISALVHLPVSVALNYAPLPAQLKLSGVSGTLWQGHANQVTWQGRNIGEVRWQLVSSKLFTGKLEAQVRFGRGSDWQLKGRGNVGYGLSGAYANNLIASIPAEQVVALAPPLPVPLGISGHVELSINEWHYASPYCKTGQGQLVWNTDSVGTPLADLVIGPVVADINCQQSEITAQGKQQSEQVSAEFELVLNDKQRYQAKAWFMPQSEMPSALAEQLKWLPKPDGQGRYQFSYNGRL